MPFEIVVDIPNLVAIVTHTGHSSVEECGRAMAELLADSRVTPEFGLLIDVRLIEFSPTTEEIRVLGRTLGSSFKNRVAFVTGTQVQYGIARQSEAYGEMLGATIEVFSEYDVAIAWLTGGEEADPFARFRGGE